MANVELTGNFLATARCLIFADSSTGVWSFNPNTNTLTITAAGGGTGFANPTATVGLTAVNGSATTMMRSDAAPELSSSIYSSLNVASTLCYRDANGNVHANNFESAIHGNAATGTITLTNASARIQTFSSGSGSAIVVLPDATTLNIGHTIELDDNASGNLTVQLSGTGTTFLTMLPGSYLVLQCTSISFTAGQWNYYWTNPATNQGLVQDSIVLSGGVAQLSGDSASPGNSYFYGTNGSGTKGWYALSTLPQGTVTSITSSNLTVAGTSAVPTINLSAGQVTNISLGGTSVQTAGSTHLVVTGTAIDLAAADKSTIASALQTAGSTHLVVTGTAIDLAAADKADIALAATAVQPGAIQNMESALWNSTSGAVQTALTVAQDILIPFACTLQEVDVLTQGPVGSCTVTILRGAASAGAISFPPATDITNGHNVACAAASVQILTATLTSQGWTTSFGQNDVLRLTLTANTSFTSVKVILRMY